MGPGYTNIALPINLSYDGSQLTGFPAGSFVTVTSGSSSVQFPIAGPATVVPYTSGSGAKITISTDTTLYPDAMSFSFSGKLNAGDGFALKANTKGVEDGGNIVRLGNLQTQNTTGGGKATFQDSYAAFVNDIGNRSSSAKISSSAQTALLSQATSARDSVSGVNLDEEAANLIKYQQAYQASAKVLEIASKIFDTLLSLQ
jgi:flagellar hook-associated protein 1 FlgK